MIKKSSIFDKFSSDPISQVFEIFPLVFSDQRGHFSEVLKEKNDDVIDTDLDWINQLSWIKQINRSTSVSGTIRGMHAQKGKFCQAKLVEALTDVVYDVIIDGRPNSQTFGVSSVFKLDPILQNKLFVPRGFLHGFIVPNAKTTAIFQYFCDNVFDKNSEVGINPESIIPDVVKQIEKLGLDYPDLIQMFKDKQQLVFSEKDQKGEDYAEWMLKTKIEYERTGKLWFL